MEVGTSGADGDVRGWMGWLDTPAQIVPKCYLLHGSTPHMHDLTLNTLSYVYISIIHALSINFLANIVGSYQGSC